MHELCRERVTRQQGRQLAVLGETTHTQNILHYRPCGREGILCPMLVEGEDIEVYATTQAPVEEEFLQTIIVTSFQGRVI
jgi:hypothetical protein